MTLFIFSWNSYLTNVSIYLNSIFFITFPWRHLDTVWNWVFSTAKSTKLKYFKGVSAIYFLRWSYVVCFISSEIFETKQFDNCFHLTNHRSPKSVQSFLSYKWCNLPDIVLVIFKSISINFCQKGFFFSGVLTYLWGCVIEFRFFVIPGSLINWDCSYPLK